MMAAFLLALAACVRIFDAFNRGFRFDPKTKVQYQRIKKKDFAGRLGELSPTLARVSL